MVEQQGGREREGEGGEVPIPIVHLGEGFERGVVGKGDSVAGKGESKRV